MMDYKVGDEVLVKGKITDIRNDCALVAIRTSTVTIDHWVNISCISKPPTVIFDPTSSEAQALVGEEVEFSDGWDFSVKYHGILQEADKSSAYPFCIHGWGYRRFIRPIPQPETISRAEAEKELEKALGKKVRIK